jgi:hypothetical protein
MSSRKFLFTLALGMAVSGSAWAQTPETKPQTAPQINLSTVPPAVPLTVPQVISETRPETRSSAETQESRPMYYRTLGGDSYETAVLVPVGEELRLLRSQPAGKYDYFVLDLKPAQLLTVSLSVGETVSDLFLFGAAGEALGQISFAGEKNLRKSIEIDAVAPQRLYLLWGSASGNMNKDEASLKLDVKNLFDIGGDSDAGATIEQALVLTKGKVYPENYLMRSDAVDFYKIATAPGETLRISLTPQNPKGILSAGLYDEIKTELGRGRSALPGGAFFVTGTSHGNTTYLQVTRDLGGEPTTYKIEFMDASHSTETMPALGATKPNPGSEGDAPVVTDRTIKTDKKKESSREDRLKSKSDTKKSPWWKNTKTLTMAGGGVAGVLVLVLILSAVMRKKARRNEEDVLN